MIDTEFNFQVLSVRTIAFEAASSESGSASVSEFSVPDTVNSGLNQWVSESIETSDRPELSSARVVIAGGRGLKSAENFNMLYKLADKLKAAGKFLEFAKHIFVSDFFYIILSV